MNAVASLARNLLIFISFQLGKENIFQCLISFAFNQKQMQREKKMKRRPQKTTAKKAISKRRGKIFKNSYWELNGMEIIIKRFFLPFVWAKSNMIAMKNCPSRKKIDFLYSHIRSRYIFVRACMNNAWAAKSAEKNNKKILLLAVLHL